MRLGALSEAQLSRTYGRASVYVATSRYEPFGLAPLEAALSRCALLMNDLPSFRELWQDDVIYFEQNNPESLLGVLAQLKQDAGLRAEYAKRAYRRAQSQFTSDRMADSGSTGATTVPLWITAVEKPPGRSSGA